ncbi:DUF2975 domain-containing protein [Jeotgalibaca sp. A127]|uniref:DUF2975 domain-containing protein n=1 Tax=Jeotgalibaca sp. A127 TaxID=3457324 RepID=UPI003FD19A8D
MKKYATLFLKIALLVLTIPVLAVMVFVLPQFISEAIQHLSEGPVIASAVLGLTGLVYLSTLPFFGALFQANKLLKYINGETAFSTLSVQALRKIKWFAFSICGLYTLALPFFYILAEWDDAPGVILVGLVFVGSALVVAVFANMLELLLEEAIRMKNEIDLTV